MDAAIVPMVPNFLTEDEVRAAELDRVRQQVADGFLGGPEHRNLGPPSVLREVPGRGESIQSKSIRSVDSKSNPLYARDMMLDVLNEMSVIPDRRRSRSDGFCRKLRALKSFVRGSCGDVPGATAKDVRDTLVLGKSRVQQSPALTELLSRRAAKRRRVLRPSS